MTEPTKAPLHWLAAALVVSALVLAIALVTAVDRFRATERYVTVKGLAEREVPADVAIWPVTFATTGVSPSAAQEALSDSEQIVRTFLADAGFPADAIGKGPPRLKDQQAESYGNPVRADERYRAELTLTLRSASTQAVQEAVQRADELVSQGVVLGSQWGDAVQYLFSGLNAIKPAMIAAATRDARDAAQQFAADSGSEVGGIRRATQGYFSISDRDAWTPEIKRVRVVTTVEYFLAD